jgi:hypothetical protein
LTKQLSFVYLSPHPHMVCLLGSASPPCTSSQPMYWRWLHVAVPFYFRMTLVASPPPHHNLVLPQVRAILFPPFSPPFWIYFQFSILYTLHPIVHIHL